MGCDVLVVGAGMVGTACALALRRAGLSVCVVDAMAPGSGTTAAGMGHLVALDDHAPELDLCLHSLALWRDFFAEHPGVGEPWHCGTLWVAESEAQMEEARLRAARLGARGYPAELLSGAQVAALEPQLRPGLAGGLRVPGDSVVYPPAVAHHIAYRLLGADALVLGARVVRIGPGEVELESGRRLRAEHIVVAAGATVGALLPEVPVFARKGHLAITDRYPGSLSHQIVSMNYGQTEPGSDALAVAANVQPRPTGQWLVGSCRQDGQTDTRLDPAVLGKVLATAIGLLPCLAGMRVLRAWAGMRPAAPDGLPLIGAHPRRSGVWLAVGHEGLGVTTALGTASLLADLILGRRPAIASAPFDPARLLQGEAHG
ncbi:FAD-binding oxidoreductase [Massilia sp. TS11]|uniref:NAD(P)/FAD-dependent oxidoreductase n=1 Tax=Massilia sp. TS11 TaxID=2908003 RepID=UPI001EDB2A20|nr:FAD-dependent oxidoreductase [Massilia sp. TS11]MCG2583079.1 FAD-binding oxidoreductase [Massilia sp. TS11]